MKNERSIGTIVDKSKATGRVSHLKPMPYYKSPLRKGNTDMRTIRTAMRVIRNTFEKFKEECFPTCLLKIWPVRYVTDQPVMSYAVLDPENGRRITILNGNLAVRQKVTPKELEALKTSHVLKDRIFTLARNTDNMFALRMLANVFETLEYEQQRLWHFPLNKDFHLFFEFPGCTCPKMDNREMLGFDRSVMDSGCPVHGIEGFIRESLQNEEEAQSHV
jgi:plasmid maintenance system killer protein